MPLYIVPPLLRLHPGGRRTDCLAGCAGHREGECRPASRHGGSLRASALRLGRAARHASARLRPRGRRRLDGGSAREPLGMHPYSEIWRILQSTRSASGAGAPRGWRRSAAGSDAGRGPARTCHLTSPPAVSRRLCGRCGARPCAALPPVPGRLGPRHHCHVPPASRSRAGPAAPRRRLPRSDAAAPGRHVEGLSPTRPLFSRRAPCLPLSGLAAFLPRCPDRLFAPLRILSAAPALPLRLGLRATPLESPRAALQGLAVLAPKDAWNCTQWRLFGRKFGVRSGDRAPPLQNCYIALFGRRRTWALASGLQPAPAGSGVRLAARPIGRHL